MEGLLTAEIMNMIFNHFLLECTGLTFVKKFRNLRAYVWVTGSFSSIETLKEKCR